MDNLETILGANTFPKEMLEQLQEAFDKKVNESRGDAEMQIRAEFSQRFEHDKSVLVEAMDRMLTDVITKTEAEKAKEIAALKESKIKFDTVVAQAKSHYRAKLVESIELFDRQIKKTLTSNVKELVESKRGFVSQKRKLNETFAKKSAAMVAEHRGHLKKIDAFVVRQMTRELSEMGADHRALIETRVRLVKEAKTRVATTQKAFIKEAAKKVETMIGATLKREIKHLHEDIETNRKNTFGRRIFEAVAAEYMTSYLSEGSEIKKLQTVLAGKTKELDVLAAQLTETTKSNELASRKIKIAEDRVLRTKIMNELMSSLKGDKRSLMESMLETTKTEQLKSAFDRLLPVVLSETRAMKPKAESRVLTETRATETRIVTGDKTSLFETRKSDEDVEYQEEFDTILRRAGITK